MHALEKVKRNAINLFVERPISFVLRDVQIYLYNHVILPVWGTSLNDHANLHPDNQNPSCVALELELRAFCESNMQTVSRI